MEKTAHNIGLVADTPAVTLQLRELVSELGQTVTYSLTPDQAYESKPLSPSLWIVISEQAADVFEALNEWSEAPIFLADDMPEEDNAIHHQQWCQSLREKLCAELEVVPPPKTKSSAQLHPVVDGFRDVWVLAASLGGPEAVRVFLENIDPKLPVTFVYAQHIEENFDRMLPKVMGKDSKFRVTYCTNGERLRQGTVLVCPSHNVAQVDAKGMMHVYEDKTWDKPYTPNINQVIDNIGDHFQHRMGVIVFSGMCDDGAEASLGLHKEGVPVWAQRPEECICPAMPDAVISGGEVDFIGTAQQLARQLNHRYSADIALSQVIARNNSEQG